MLHCLQNNNCLGSIKALKWNKESSVRLYDEPKEEEKTLEWDREEGWSESSEAVIMAVYKAAE